VVDQTNFFPRARQADSPASQEAWIQSGRHDFVWFPPPALAADRSRTARYHENRASHLRYPSRFQSPVWFTGLIEAYTDSITYQRSVRMSRHMPPCILLQCARRFHWLWGYRSQDAAPGALEWHFGVWSSGPASSYWSLELSQSLNT
jgi:hypothetical protein